MVERPHLFFAILFIGCGSELQMDEPKAEVDAGPGVTLDAGVMDTGSLAKDLGPPDNGVPPPPDLGPPDTGPATPDAGPEDLGVPDTGPAPCMPIAATPIETGARFPILARSGDTLGVLYSHGGAFKLAPLTAQGQPTGSVRSLTTTPGSYGKALAGYEDGFAVAWTDSRGGEEMIFFSLVDRSGAVIAPDKQVGGPDTGGLARAPKVAWSPEGFAITWIGRRSDGNQAFFFTMLDLTGTQVVVPTKEVTVAGNLAEGPSLVYDGSGFGMAWNLFEPGPPFGFDIFFVQLDLMGNRMGNVRQLTNAESLSGPPVMSWSSNQYGLAWIEDLSGAGLEVHFIRLDAQGTALSMPVSLSTAPGNHATPILINDGAGFSAMWPLSNVNNTASDILWSRVNTAGRATPMGPLVTNMGRALRPSATRTDEHMVLVWELLSTPSIIMFQAECL